MVKKHTILLRDIGNWGAGVCVSGYKGVCGKPSYIPLSFAVNLKLL